MIVKCASPTCAKTTVANVVFLRDILTQLGWRERRGPDDDRPRWYCRRCVA